MLKNGLKINRLPFVIRSPTLTNVKLIQEKLWRTQEHSLKHKSITKLSYLERRSKHWSRAWVSLNKLKQGLQGFIKKMSTQLINSDKNLFLTLIIQRSILKYNYLTELRPSFLILSFSSPFNIRLK